MVHSYTYVHSTAYVYMGWLATYCACTVHQRHIQLEFIACCSIHAPTPTYGGGGAPHILHKMLDMFNLYYVVIMHGVAYNAAPVLM